MPGKQAYIEKGLDEDAYRTKGKEKADAVQREDAQRISSYEGSMSETKMARATVQSAKASMEVLKQAGVTRG